MLDNPNENLILITDEEYNKLPWSDRMDYCLAIATHMIRIRNETHILNDTLHEQIWAPAIKHNQENPEHQSLKPIRDLLEKIHELTQTHKEDKPC